MIDELAKVVAIHPESNCVDVVVLRTGARLAAVRVLSATATGQTGIANLHLPDCTGGYDSDNTGKRDIVAALEYYREMPFVVGFLYPEVSECLFARPDFKVDRHASDVYHTINANGDMELHHPSGAYVRIAESPAHEDLTGQDYDGIWSIQRNTGRAVHIHIEQAGGVASVNIDPAGNIDIIHDGNLTAATGGNLSASVGGNISATAGGTATVTSGGAMELNAPLITLNAPNIVLNGALTQGKGGNGGACAMLGPITVINDVIAGGKSLMNHDHQGDSGGTTGPPN